MDSNKIKRGLGRGLSSLIGETKVETQKNKLSVSDLVPNKYQPRKIFDEENLNELANSNDFKSSASVMTTGTSCRPTF